jgi:predicted transcriptional regulator
METQTVTAHISKELVAKIDAITARHDRPRGWAVKEALADWVAAQEERELLMQEGFADIDAGRTIPHEDMKRWALSLGTDKPLSRPKA